MSSAARDESTLSLDVKFATRRHLLSSSRVDGATLSLFVPTTHFPPTGTEVRLSVTFGDSPVRFELWGKVQFHRPMARGPGQSAGVALCFEGEQKKAAAQMLAACAGRSEALGSAHSPRFGRAIDCILRVGNKALSAQVRDLSASGAFIVSPQVSRIRVGAEVVLELRRGFLGLGAKRLTAKVVWFGQKGGTVGFGARFLGGPATIRPTLRGYLP